MWSWIWGDHWSPTSGRRSGGWKAVRNAHLAAEPVCQVCGGTRSLQVHHKQPFHFRPSLELDPANLMTLCEASHRNCHLIFGHLGDWKAWNPDVVMDAGAMSRKIRLRPYEAAA